MKYMTRIVFATLALALGSTGWGQGVFNKYAPQPGIQVSTGVDYHNTAAVSTDVTTLFGCTTPGQFLNQAGGCTVPAGTGVTSVAVPAPLTATSCSGGACVLSWTTGQTANRILATPDATTGAVSLRAMVAGDVPPINLGSTANGGVSSATILLGTNGGTSNGFFSVTGPTTALRTFTFPNASATVLTTNAAVTVPQGGTGLATLTANGVLLGEGTSNVNPLVMGADTVLRGTASADPVAAAVPNCGSGTTALNYSTSTHAFGCQTITAGGTGTVTNVATGTGLTGGPITSTGTLSVDQTAALTWTGLETFQAGVIATTARPTIASGTSGVYLGATSGGISQLAMVDSAGGTDSKLWDMFVDATTFHARALNDANSASLEWLTAVRTGVASVAITFTTPKGVFQTNSTGEALRLQGSTAGVTSKAFMSFGDSAGARMGYIGSTGTAGGPIILEADNSDIRFIPIATTGTVSVSSDGGASFVPVTKGPPRIIWAASTGTSGGCTILNSNYVTGCSRLGAGSYSITTPTANNNMGCTASPTSSPSNGGINAAVTGSSSAVTVVIKNAAGTAVDEGFQFVCMTIN